MRIKTIGRGIVAGHEVVTVQRGSPATFVIAADVTGDRLNGRRDDADSRSCA
jgi:hypothetical protein